MASFIWSTSSNHSMIPLWACGIRLEWGVQQSGWRDYKISCRMRYQHIYIAPKVKQSTSGPHSNGFEQWSGNFPSAMAIYPPPQQRQL